MRTTKVTTKKGLTFNIYELEQLCSDAAFTEDTLVQLQQEQGAGKRSQRGYYTSRLRLWRRFMRALATHIDLFTGVGVQ